MRVTKTKNDFPRLDPDVYLAKICEIKEAEHAKNGSYLQIFFLVKDAMSGGSPCDGEFKTMAGFPCKLTVGNKLDKLLTAVGVTTDEGDEVELEDSLIGKVCKIVVNDVKKKDGSSVVTITDVLPAKRKDPDQKAEAPKPQPKPEPKLETPKPTPKASDDDLFAF